METGILLGRVKERLSIEKLTPLQHEMAALKLPARAVLLSPTGSGKTLAFALLLLRSLNVGEGGVRGVVMAPTRELVLQVYDVLRTLAHPGLKVAVCYGGHSVETEKNALAADPDIVVATPGRLLDHLQRGHVSVHGVTSLVLDEYDKSLELGFLGEMRSIVGRMKNLRTVVLTSATVLSELPDFIGRAPFRTFDYTAEGREAEPDVTFLKVESPSADKLETLDALLSDLGGEKVIVFLNHRDAAERVWKHLAGRGYPAGLYHGGLDQDLRERALIMFSNGTTPVLVSTDLASRGLDIDGVGAVVHYHLPPTAEAMTHRNGRTGRMGASGRAFAIVSDSDKVPDFFPALDSYWPEAAGTPCPSGLATLYLNAGKKEKISRGDIAGFMIHKGGLEPAEVGRIDVRDHCAYVAVPSARADAVVRALASHKIKNTRVRVSKIGK